MTFVLVVILQSFVLYCVDASFISGREMDCTIFENVVSDLFSCSFLASKLLMLFVTFNFMIAFSLNQISQMFDFGK